VQRDYPTGELPEREPLPDYSAVPDLELLWQFDVRDRVDGALSFDAATQTLFLGTESGIVMAVDARRGTLRWAHDAVGEVTSAPAFDGSQVYVGFREPGGAVALDKGSGRQAWRTVAVGWVARDPVVQSGGVFFVSASELLVLRPQTGERAASYRLDIPRTSTLSNLFATAEGVAAAYNSAQESGAVVVPDVHRAASTAFPLAHHVDLIVPRLPGSLLVQGPAIDGGGDVLTEIELSGGNGGRALQLHAGSRLLGAVEERVLVSTVPPAIVSLDPDSFETSWATRRYHPASRAYPGPERSVTSNGTPGNAPLPPSLFATGRGQEGVVGYQPDSGEIRYHYAIDEELIVRGAARSAERIFILVSSSGGGRASLVALGLNGLAEN
jgi:hypothetical protein